MIRSFIFIYFLTVSFLCSHFFQGNELKESIARGSAVYKKQCAVCHKKDGSGKKKIPPLAASDYLLKNRKESIRGIKFGQNAEIVVNGTLYDKKMPPSGLADKEIADVMNYILNSWGNTSSKMVSESEVREIN